MGCKVIFLSVCVKKDNSAEKVICSRSLGEWEMSAIRSQHKRGCRKKRGCFKTWTQIEITIFRNLVCLFETPCIVSVFLFSSRFCLFVFNYLYCWVVMNFYNLCVFEGVSARTLFNRS